MIVMTSECDLFQDWRNRFSTASLAQGTPQPPNLLQHVILCDLYLEENVRSRVSGSDVWRRVRQNQDERYHRLPSAGFGNATVTLPSLYLDFRQTYGIPTDRLYEGLVAGGVLRIAVVPPVYLHDLIHRYYGFQSRVGLPDFD
jgi:hypothetical protein